MIVDHPNYAGMPCTRDDSGKIDWTIPSNRSKGSKNWNGNTLRRDWWRQQAIGLGIALQGNWLSKTARRLHPTGEKPCQICGRLMTLSYAYPTRATAARLNAHLAPESAIDPLAFLTIDEIVDQLFEADPDEAIRALRSSIPELAGAATLADVKGACQAMVRDESRRLSPGSMSNAPDRLDGFHTYNLCCRGGQDTGRTAANLGSYGVDRRAYEQWCEGDWAAADTLMHLAGRGVCHQPNCQSGGAEVQLTADHVGPISLGFRHTPRFVVACRTCNSGKGNRMRLSDITTLLRWELETGESQVSWQARCLWDQLKTEVADDDAALRLSRLMRINQHHYLSVLGTAAYRGAGDALVTYLDLDCAANRYEFEGLDTTTLEYDQMVASARQDGYARSKRARALRIAFDALRQYSTHDARNIHSVPEAETLPTTASINRRINDLLLVASPFRSALNAALDGTGEGRDEDLARLLDHVVDEPYELAMARRDLAEAISAHMDEICRVLVARFRAGTHMR